MGVPPITKISDEKNILTFDFEEEDVIEVKLPKPKLSPKEQADRLLEIAAFKPAKKAFLDAEDAFSGDAPLVDPEQDSPFTKGPAIGSTPAARLAELTPEERGPSTLPTGSVPPTKPLPETLLSDLEKRAITNYCQTVSIRGSKGEQRFAYRLKPNLSGKKQAEVKVALARQGFVAVSIDDRKKQPVGVVYVQHHVADALEIGKKGFILDGRGRPQPVRYTVALGGRKVPFRKDLEARIARINDTHRAGEGITPETADMMRVLERGVNNLKFGFPTQHLAQRPVEPETTRAAHAEVDWTDATARQKAMEIADAKSDVANTFIGATQVDYRTTKDPTALKIYRALGYREVAISCIQNFQPVIVKAFVAPEHLSLAQASVREFLKKEMVAGKSAEGIPYYRLPKEVTPELAQAVKLLGMKEILYNVSKNQAAYVYALPSDYPKIKQEKIPGTRQITFQDADGNDVGAYQITHVDGEITLTLDQGFGESNRLLAGNTVYYTKGNLQVLANAIKGQDKIIYGK